MNKIKMKIQNRLFQKGDKVRFINQGRILPPLFDYDKTYTVTQKETETGVVSVDNIDFSSFWLELVEPVEKNYPLVFHEAVKYLMDGHILERISPVRIAIIWIRVTENQVQGRLKGFTDEKSWSIYSLDYEDFQSRWRLVD